MAFHKANTSVQSITTPAGEKLSLSTQHDSCQKNPADERKLGINPYNPKSKPEVSADYTFYGKESNVVTVRGMGLPVQNFVQRKIEQEEKLQLQVKKTTPLPFLQRLPSTPGISSTPRTTTSTGIGQVRYRPTGEITRLEFDNYVRTYFGVNDVHTGTQTEQEQRITRHGVPAPTIPTWQSWDPGSSSEDYTSIIDGMEEMIDILGAMPQINRILFFKTSYETDPTSGVGIPQPSTGASFGAGEMVIYESFHGSTHPATGVSTSQGTPTRTRSRSSNISYTIIHELGHGIAEAGSNNSRQMFDQYRAHVGWMGSPSVLYDMGQPVVEAAITNGTPLPSAHIIIPRRWNDATVIEQPMSFYAVEGGPGEDFAESIAAYVTNSSVLQQRSPRRFNFIHTHMATWITRMRAMIPGLVKPPMGDFPVPTGDTRMA